MKVLLVSFKYLMCPVCFFAWQGLGKSQQGSTEHIKVKVKNNTQGLGTSISNEVRKHSYFFLIYRIFLGLSSLKLWCLCFQDNWIAHQDDFDQLLADLNSCHGQNNTESKTSLWHKVFTYCLRY